MKLMKIMYYVNIAIIVIETIAIFLYNESMLWLAVMLSAIIAQLLGVKAMMKKEISSKENNQNEAL